jgi:hypothetical protein
MSQTELHPVTGACRHLRGRYKITPSHKSPFPERRLINYECELGLEIASDEEIDKCSEPRVECWKTDKG